MPDRWKYAELIQFARTSKPSFDMRLRCSPVERQDPEEYDDLRFDYLIFYKPDGGDHHQGRISQTQVWRCRRTSWWSSFSGEDLIEEIDVLITLSTKDIKRWTVEFTAQKTWWTVFKELERRHSNRTRIHWAIRSSVSEYVDTWKVMISEYGRGQRIVIPNGFEESIQTIINEQDR